MFTERVNSHNRRNGTGPEASRATGLDPALIVRVVSALGTAPAQVERRSADDIALLRYVAAVLDAGLPLVALLQLVRVYGQAMARVADAVVGHMESDLEDDAIDLGRMRVAVAFADLTGYTRLTEEQGEIEAVDAVERFVEMVKGTLPDDARVIKTIGDAVMIVGSDPAALADWAVAFQRLEAGRVPARIADVRLKGFSESTEIFVARERDAA